MAYQFEREAGVVADVRSLSTQFRDIIAKLRKLGKRWEALDATFLDAFYEAGNPGEGRDVTRSEILAAISSFNAIVNAYEVSSHDRNLELVAHSGI